MGGPKPQKAKVSQEEKDAQAAALQQQRSETAAAADLEDMRRRRGYGTGAFTQPLTASQLPLLSGYLGA